MKEDFLKDKTKMKLEEVIKYAEKKDKKHSAGTDFLYKVDVKHGDGSTFKLRFAKYELIDKFLIVYTEHNGILYFYCEDLIYAKASEYNRQNRKYKKYELIVDNPF